MTRQSWGAAVLRRVVSAPSGPLAVLAFVAAMAALAVTAEEPGKSPVSATDGAKAFVEVAKVLQSPRCMNCHPAGDRPLQTDASTPHKMNVSRTGEAAGLECATCHREKNSEALGVPGGPPGAPNWHLPPRDMPMVFEGLTAARLCAQLKDPNRNGHKTLAQLLHHVSEDPLVLWGWNPGGNRHETTTQPRRFRAAVCGLGGLGRSLSGPVKTRTSAQRNEGLEVAESAEETRKTQNFFNYETLRLPRFSCAFRVQTACVSQRSARSSKSPRSSERSEAPTGPNQVFWRSRRHQPSDRSSVNS